MSLIVPLTRVFTMNKILFVFCGGFETAGLAYAFRRHCFRGRCTTRISQTFLSSDILTNNLRPVKNKKAVVIAGIAPPEGVGVEDKSQVS